MHCACINNIIKIINITSVYTVHSPSLKDSINQGIDMLLTIYKLFVVLRIDWCFQVEHSVEFLSCLLAPLEKSEETLGHIILTMVFNLHS